MRYTPNGKPVAQFSLALYAGKDQQGNEETTWVRVTAWKPLAEAITDKVHKGDKIQVEGYLQPPRIWLDKDGNPVQPPRASIELTAFSIKALAFTAVDLFPKTTALDQVLDNLPPGLVVAGTTKTRSSKTK
jgi:single-strand DNA-binding protein